MTRTEYQKLLDRLTVSKDPKERTLLKAMTFLPAYSANYKFDEE